MENNKGEHERMVERIMDLADPNSGYTQADFDKEFSYANHTMSGADFWKLNLVFANKSDNPDPDYATNGSSGFDLRAYLIAPVTIKAGKRAVIQTGLYFEIPENFEIQIRPRSGLAAKNGVTVLNTPGTIDADYRGEIKVILINLGEEDFTINSGDRIAQAVIASAITKNLFAFTKVNDVSIDTGRGAGGFGSTGKN